MFLRSLRSTITAVDLFSPCKYACKFTEKITAWPSLLHTVSLFVFNRSSAIFKGDPELNASVNNFRSWVASAEAMAEKYAAPPSDIDFASAKGAVRDKELVASLEKMYASGNPPAETHEWSSDDQADKANQIEEAKGRLAFLNDVVEETKKEIEYMKVNRTTRETDATDLKEMYPDIAEEIETELENREWFKDTIVK